MELARSMASPRSFLKGSFGVSQIAGLSLPRCPLHQMPLSRAEFRHIDPCSSAQLFRKPDWILGKITDNAEQGC